MEFVAVSGHSAHLSKHESNILYYIAGYHTTIVSNISNEKSRKYFDYYDAIISMNILPNTKKSIK